MKRTLRGRQPLATDMRHAVAISAAALATGLTFYLGYLLIDVLLLFFLGIVVAAAVQPWHQQLCRFGIPKGAALLLVFLPFLLALAGICFLIGPTLFEQLSSFAAAVPDSYASFRDSLRDGGRLARIVGQRMPSFDQLTQAGAGLVPGFFQGALQFTASVIGIFAYFVTVIAIAFYWTMELPRIERLVLSFFPVARRARALTIWHEIEMTLGAFIRGQGILMLIIGVGSAIGYWAIGLPNVLVLAVLAGLFEAVPVVGPVLAAIPAIAVALPLGFNTVALAVGFSLLLQGIENNILVPRIMSKATGTSALVGMIAVLAFGILYGVLGVFIAIPIAAVVQILIDRALVNTEEPAEATSAAQAPEDLLRARVRALQQQVRTRLRQRETRMGIDPGSAEHRVDAFDQQIEAAVDRIERILAAPATFTAGSAEQRAAVIDALQEVTDRFEAALERVEPLPSPPGTAPAADVPETGADAVAEVAEQVDEAVDRVESVLGETAPEAVAAARHVDDDRQHRLPRSG